MARKPRETWEFFLGRAFGQEWRIAPAGRGATMPRISKAAGTVADIKCLIALKVPRLALIFVRIWPDPPRHQGIALQRKLLGVIYCDCDPPTFLCSCSNLHFCGVHGVYRGLSNIFSTGIKNMRCNIIWASSCSHCLWTFKSTSNVSPFCRMEVICAENFRRGGRDSC